MQSPNELDLDPRIQAVVDAAPPLTAEQADRLRALLPPVPPDERRDAA